MCEFCQDRYAVAVLVNGDRRVCGPCKVVEEGLVQTFDVTTRDHFAALELVSL